MKLKRGCEAGIRLITPDQTLEYHYILLMDAITGLGNATDLGGFSEAMIGDHRLEVYVEGNLRPVQVYFASTITDQQKLMLSTSAIE